MPREPHHRRHGAPALGRIRRPGQAAAKQTSACLRWNPVTATNSFSIWTRSSDCFAHTARVAVTNSSRVAMPTRLISAPPKPSRATNQMRQQVPSQQHFRRGNAWGDPFPEELLNSLGGRGPNEKIMT